MSDHRIVVIDGQSPGPELDALMAEIGEPTVTVEIGGADAKLAKTIAYMLQNSVRKNIFATRKEEARVLITVVQP